MVKGGSCLTLLQGQGSFVEGLGGGGCAQCVLMCLVYSIEVQRCLYCTIIDYSFGAWRRLPKLISCAATRVTFSFKLVVLIGGSLLNGSVSTSAKVLSVGV